VRSVPDLLQWSRQRGADETLRSEKSKKCSDSETCRVFMFQKVVVDLNDISRCLLRELRF